MATTPHLWTLQKLRSARSSPDGSVEVDPNSPIVFTIPAFQRSLVWPKKKQKALIAAILRGYPFGALLLVQNKSREVTLSDGTTVEAADYGIIDGLQRTNAIVEHLRSSLSMATADVLTGAAYDDFRTAVRDSLRQTLTDDQIANAVLSWMHATERPDLENGFDWDTLLESLCEQLNLPAPGLPERAGVKPYANAFLKHLAAAVDISNLQVPVLIYDGPREYLPEIFEQINTAGTVLSKYEIYAASWLDARVKVETKEVRDAISRRYNLLRDEGFTVDGESSDNEFSLFDYLHGLSQYLGSSYPNLFSKSAAANNKLSSAFPLATLMLGKSLAEMGDIAQQFKVEDGLLKVAKFQAALMKSVEIVNDILAPYLAFKFTSDSEAVPHSELQIVSMIAAVAAHLFDHSKDFEDRGTVAQRKAVRGKFETAIPQHYIYDIIRQQWRGSLYTYASERVWDAGSPSSTYLKPVDLESFDNALASSLIEQLDAVTQKRPNVSSADRVFLRFLYSPVVSVGDQATHKFDVEHLIPVKRIQGMTENGPPWAIGAMGNLAVLPAGPNRRKRDETVVEYVSRKKRKPSDSVIALLKKMILVPFDAVAIPQDESGDAMTKSEYEEFVRKNWAAMSDLLKENVGIS